MGVGGGSVDVARVEEDAELARVDVLRRPCFGLSALWSIGSMRQPAKPQARSPCESDSSARGCMSWCAGATRFFTTNPSMSTGGGGVNSSPSSEAGDIGGGGAGDGPGDGDGSRILEDDAERLMVRSEALEPRLERVEMRSSALSISAAPAGSCDGCGD